MNKPEELKPIEDRFVLEYLKDLSPKRAAIRAGYSKTSAHVHGYRLMHRPRVLAAIERAKKATALRLEITRDEWLRELQLIAFSDLANHVDIDGKTRAIRAKAINEMPGNTRRALESITEIKTGSGRNASERVTFKLHSKVEALKIIGKHLGFLVDDFKLSGALALNAKLSMSDMKKSLKGIEDGTRT
jgi:phage terminase small subunit